MKLIAMEKQPSLRQVAVRCLASLLDAVPHFNYRENILASVIKNISSPDDTIRYLSMSLCCFLLCFVLILLKYYYNKELVHNCSTSEFLIANLLGSMR